VLSPKILKSRHPIWDLEPIKDAMEKICKKRWKNSGVWNVSLINNPELRVPGFKLLRALYGARTKQGKCNYLM
jgi:hypothetical protein